jgi:hypothetical protein
MLWPIIRQDRGNVGVILLGYIAGLGSGFYDSLWERETPVSMACLRGKRGMSRRKEDRRKSARVLASEVLLML